MELSQTFTSYLTEVVVPLYVGPEHSTLVNMYVGSCTKLLL